MEDITERLGEEQQMLAKQYPNFLLDTQKRVCRGEVFSCVPSKVYKVTIQFPEKYPEEPPHISIDFPQNPVIDNFVNKIFQPTELPSIVHWNPQNNFIDVIIELEKYVRKKEESIAILFKERDDLNKKKPNFGFSKDFRICRGIVFSQKLASATYDVEISIKAQFPRERPEVRALKPNDPLLSHWVDLTIRPSDLPSLANWEPSSRICGILEELEEVIHARETKAERILQEMDILRKRNPTFGFTPDGATCKGVIYSNVGQKVYQVTIVLSQAFPMQPPSVVVVPPDEPLIKAYVDTNFSPSVLKSTSQWNPQTHVDDVVQELHQLIYSREGGLLKRMIDERMTIRKKWPNFGFTTDMKECNGVVYTSSRNNYQVIIDLRGFPQSVPKVRAQGIALANSQLDLPVLRNWNLSTTIDMVLEAIQDEIRQRDTCYASINAELESLRTFWGSLDFLPGNLRKARGSKTISLPQGDCHITLDITFPPDYPETPPDISLNGSGYKSNEIKTLETSLKRKISTSWSQCKKISEILKQFPEDLINVLIGIDQITNTDFKEEIRAKQPIYYCKQCMNDPSRRICYFHKKSLDTIVERGGRCIIYQDRLIHDGDIERLQP